MSKDIKSEFTQERKTVYEKNCQQIVNHPTKKLGIIISRFKEGKDNYGKNKTVLMIRFHSDPVCTFMLETEILNCIQWAE